MKLERLNICRFEMKKNPQKIGLGTAQFGLPYGISNTSGKVNLKEVRKIIETAKEHNCTVIDTAPSYGNAEAVLGKNRDILSHFRILTKTPVLKNFASHKIRSYLRSTFFKSLKKIGLEKIEGLLVHHVNDLMGNNNCDVISTLKELKAEGLVNKIGFSCYTPEEAEKILDFFTPDVIQIPVNVFNQEFVHHPILKKLKKTGCEIHARSLFLQGLVFLASRQWPSYFAPFQEILNKFHYDLQEKGISPLEACLHYVLQIPEIDHAIIGVCQKNELRKAVKTSLLPIKNISWDLYRNCNPRLIDPSLWKL